ncbi:MAG: DUF4760 domain-containing protein [Chloroflexi bacterium]|nr:DUF4760 domain-containing protein [Chloroflexota bacterium]
MRKIFGLAFLGFLAWMVLILVLWLVLRAFNFATSFWTMAGALSSALTGASIAVAGFVAYRELSEAENDRREAEKSRHIDIADRLFNELNLQENIKARKWVYKSMPADPKIWQANPTPEGAEAIKRVLNSLDRVSFLTQEGWISDDVVMPWMHPMIAKSWEKLGTYVRYEREQRKEPYFYFYAEQVANRCRNWRIKHGYDEPTHWIDKGI